MATCGRDRSTLTAGDRFALNVGDGAWAGSLAKMDGFVSCLAQTWLHEGAGASLPVLTGDIDALAERLPPRSGVR